MEYSEYYTFSCELEELAWSNIYRIDVLKGYCENQAEKVSADMVASILKEILDRQILLIKKIDSYSTQFGNLVLSED